ncbi:MAG: hypothetical protein QM756_28440 [Polyangiaceae bacterium]
MSLRVWDELEGDLVEREGIEATAASRVLPGVWVVSYDVPAFPMLRLSRDEGGKDSVPDANRARAARGRAAARASRA